MQADSSLNPFHVRKRRHSSSGLGNWSSFSSASILPAWPVRSLKRKPAPFEEKAKGTPSISAYSSAHWFAGITYGQKNQSYAE